MVNNSFSFLLIFIMCVFSSRPEEPAGLFFYLFTFNRLFTFLLFYLFTFNRPFYRMVIVGTKCEESALVEMLFSCCCRWFFPMTRPAVHELVRKVTMAEQMATTR